MSHERFERYEQALRRALGADQLIPTTATMSCQLVFDPAFHAPFCLTLALAEQWGELSFSLLVNHSTYPLFQSVWQGHRVAEEEEIGLARLACLEDIVGLCATDTAALRQQLLVLDVATLEDVDLAERDGVGIRCYFHNQTVRHTLRMQSPTVADAPRHRLLIDWAIQTVSGYFHQSQLQDYLRALGGYLG